jgi:hypothetical protein
MELFDAKLSYSFSNFLRVIRRIVTCRVLHHISPYARDRKSRGLVFLTDDGMTKRNISTPSLRCTGGRRTNWANSSQSVWTKYFCTDDRQTNRNISTPSHPKWGTWNNSAPGFRIILQPFTLSHYTLTTWYFSPLSLYAFFLFNIS